MLLSKYFPVLFANCLDCFQFMMLFHTWEKDECYPHIENLLTALAISLSRSVHNRNQPWWKEWFMTPGLTNPFILQLPSNTPFVTHRHHDMATFWQLSEAFFECEILQVHIMKRIPIHTDDNILFIFSGISFSFIVFLWSHFSIDAFDNILFLYLSTYSIILWRWRTSWSCFLLKSEPLNMRCHSFSCLD